jgi:hypothetical protein
VTERSPFVVPGAPGVPEDERITDMKTQVVHLADELVEKTLSGQVVRVFVLTMQENGALGINGRGGYNSDYMGMLHAALQIMQHQMLVSMRQGPPRDA